MSCPDLRPGTDRAPDIRLIAFTDAGRELAGRLAALLELPPEAAQRCGQPLDLRTWTARGFAEGADALVFVGAAGIAVRAVAPCVASKASDPAVVAVDEAARFAIPLLSGHLGGANELALRIAGLVGATPALTTATDVRGVFAVDSWARSQGCAVQNPERIKAVSGALLAGRTVRLWSAWPIAGAAPAGVEVVDDPTLADVVLALGEKPAVLPEKPAPSGAPANPEAAARPSEAPPFSPASRPLCLVPRIVVLGIGCRRGTPAETLEHAIEAALAEAGVWEQALAKACTIDLKADEPGLREFCTAHGLALEVFSAEELARVPGEFSGSAFVRSVTGVDNVCERAAVLGSGGELLLPKRTRDGVTVALAAAPFAPTWERGGRPAVAWTTGGRTGGEPAAGTPTLAAGNKTKEPDHAL